MSDLTSQYVIAQEEHDYNKKYEEGTIVKHTIDDVTTAYTAKKNVPQFISILNENYWKKIASTSSSGGGGVDIFDEDVEATDAQRNKALANVSNQTANSTTGKMGYKVLDSTKTFAEQVTAENTIYEIRDVFDLNSGSVTIPTGSTLKFNGGVLKNGTINSQDTIIDAGHNKIFDNVNFIGKICDSLFKVEWFVDVYTNGVINTNLCAASQFEEAMNCGVNYLTIGKDRFYPIQRTITYTGTVNILAENQPSLTNYESRIDSLRKPCIYSNNVITLLDYRFSSPNDGGVKSQQLYLRGLNLLCNKSYENLDEKDTPILKITSVTNLLGVTIDANIKAKDCNIQIVNEDDGQHYCIPSAVISAGSTLYSFIPNYTGIMLVSTSNGFMTSVTIEGSISTVFKGVGCIRGEGSGAWMTCMNLNCSTNCVIGAELGSFFPPLIVTNQHQATSGLAVNNGKAYFESSVIALNGFVYDVYNEVKKNGVGIGIYNVQKTTHLSNNDSTAIISLDGLQTDSSFVDKLILNTSIEDFAKKVGNVNDLFSSGNALNDCLNSNVEGNRFYFLSNIYYKVKSNDVELWDNAENMLTFRGSNTYFSEIHNVHKIFGENINIPYTSIGNTIRSNYPYVTIDSNYSNKDLNFMVKFNYSYSSIGCNNSNYKIMILNFQETYSSNINVKILDDNDTILYEKSLTLGCFYSNKCVIIPLYTSGKVEISWSKKGVNMLLPLIFIPNIMLSNSIKYISGLNAPSCPRSESILFRQRDENRLFFSKASYDSNVYTKFYDADGFLMNRKVGTTSQRPTSGNVSEGYQYYDSDLKKYILWNGTDWVNLDGTSLS